VVARAKKVTWFNLVAGLVVGATANPFVGGALAYAATSDLVVAQVQSRAAHTHAALSKAIECQRQGDYEAADTLFKDVLTRLADLTPTELEEYKRFSQDNVTALAARQNARRYLGRAEMALVQGHNGQALEELKNASLNEQFMTAADKERLLDLSVRLKAPLPTPTPTNPEAQPAAPEKSKAARDVKLPYGSSSAPVKDPVAVPRPAPAHAPEELDMVRALVKEARAQLGQGNFEACEAMLADAEGVPVTFAKGEDTPAKVREDLAKAKTDAKALLAAARSAFSRKDYNRAEQYAHLSEKASSLWYLTIAGDTPAKVLKDVQAARAQAAGPKPEVQPKAEVARTEVPKTVPAEKPAPGMFDSVKNVFTPSSTKVEQSPYARVGAEQKVTTNASPVANDSETPDNTDMARMILKDGRRALQKGDLVLAHKLANQAKSVKSKLMPGEDTPDLLLTDLARAEGVAKPVKPEQPAVAEANKSAKPAAKSQRVEALELLRKGRDDLAANKIDDALKCAMQAKALNVKWGWIEDNPDALIRDLEELRAKRNLDESVKVLADGRKMLEKKDYDAAMRAAYRAQTLHGSYHIWELGDRPENLIADVEAARARKTKIETPPDVVVKKDALPPPAPPPVDKDVKPATLITKGPKPGEEVKPVVATEVKPATPRPGTVAPPPFIPGGGSAPAAVAERPVDPVVKPAPVLDTNKAQAVRLLAEARKLLLDGDLVKAKEKCQEAERFHVAFSMDEESPSDLTQHITRVAVQRMKGLVAQANDTASDAKKPEAERFAAAEQDLLQARALAELFGLDTAMVDSQLKLVKHLNALALAEKTKTAAPVVETHDEAPVDPMQKKGRDLLDKARNLLRAGMTAKAREMADEACQKEYGVVEEAEAVLRSIDTEEFNQQVIAEQRKFAVVQSAFNRREFGNARALLDTVNTKALTPVQAVRLKEMLQVPEMQPQPSETEVVRANNPSAAPAGPTSPENVLPPPPGAANDGKAHVADADPQQSILKATEAMRVVQFDKMRKQGLEAQRQAAEKFRTGQMDSAIDTLKDYLETLSKEHLDTNQTAMLKRPVESRLEQFRLLKEQNEWQNQDKTVAKVGFAEHDRKIAAERSKQERVSELMRQFNRFYHDGHYQEAEKYAQLALELDPDNGIAAGALTLAQRHQAINDAESTKKEREAFRVKAARDEEHYGNYTDVQNPIAINKERNGISSKRTQLVGISARKPAEREIEARMNVPVGMHFSNTSLEQAMYDLHVMHGINFWIDQQALNDRGISKDHPVTINLEQISLKSALKLMLQNLNLTYIVKDETVQITTADRARGGLQRLTVQVADLVIPIRDSAMPANPFAQGMGSTADTSATLPAIGATPGAGYNSMPGGGGVGTPGGTSQASPFASLNNQPGNRNGNWVTSKATQTMEDALINLIKRSIEPNTWNDMGGSGTIEYFGPTMSLVINQTIDIQEQIQDLLAALRALQDQEVAIEVRFITIADDFYERIGVDFNLDIQTNKQNAKFQPALLASAFSPQGFINNPQFKGLISGLTPAGTLTNDLSIPINANSFAASFPNFGGYIPGTGGLNIGLAFLSDIQVFLFLEAVAGDVRTNVMTAPKLTLENGQTSTIIVGEGTRNFLTNVTYAVLNGQIVAIPQITSIAQSGVTVAMQAVISADRRFVRLSPTLTLTNISNTTPSATTPIQLPLYPTLLDFSNGQQPVVFTQYISAPSVNTIAVATTVTVPDGGTVLMGGLKIMSEGRNEYGSPILSKIPYLNRLFRNTSYGRDARSLMLMVTPRIIIQAEEEERQTGYVKPSQNQ
jgi:type II secretory pathway component GspD/PulD (secretin)